MLPMVQTEPVLFNGGVHSINEAATPSTALAPSLTPDSDIDDLVDIFFEVDAAVTSYCRVESCDPQLGDTWRGMQGKMSMTTPVKKIKKKTDYKPLSQINKCYNEKRRRELENETINQLEELLGTCLAEVKQPDKNGIVREATRQIQEILKRRRECPSDCPLRVQRLSPVQGGEVSSTQSHSCAGSYYLQISSLIEALKYYTNDLGWVLLEINAEGEIKCVTDNIKDLIFIDRSELYNKSIYSLVHVKDHQKIKPLLKSIQTFGWNSKDVEKFHGIQAQFIIKNTIGTECLSCVEVVIHAAAVRGSSSEESGSVMCVIRRCEDASAAIIPDAGGPPAITAKPADHIIFRLNTNYTILSCDLSGVESSINTPVSLVGTCYLDLVESEARSRIAAHLQEVTCFPEPPAISDPFRLQLGPEGAWLRVSARSRLFHSTSGETNFIMSTHNILTEDDMDLLDTDRPRAIQLPPPPPAIANGEASACPPRYRSPVSPGDAHFSINDFEFDPWPTGLLGDISEDESKDRKDISSVEGPATPLTPRAPSTPGEGSATSQPAEEPNRLRTLLSKKPVSASDGATNNTNNRILKDLLKQEDEETTGSEISAPHTPHTPHTPMTPHTPNAALSPLHSAQAHQRPQPHGSHPPHSHASHSNSAPHSHQQPHHNNSDVLLRILNDKSDEDAEENRRNSSDGRGGSSGGSQPSALLCQLLTSNGPAAGARSTHDAVDNYLEHIAGVKRKLDEKGTPPPLKRATPENQQQVSSSGVTSASASTASSVASSAATSPPACSSAGMSPLCQKNQILVSLLARQQTTPTTPIPLPNPNLRAYGPATRPRMPHPHPHQQPPQQPHPHQQQHSHQHPQHAHQQVPQQRHHHSTLSNILSNNNHNRTSNVNGSSVGPNVGVGSGGGGASTEGSGSHLQMMLQGAALQGPTRAYPMPPVPPTASLHYANTAPHPIYNNQTPSGNTRGQGNGGSGGDGEGPNDQILSDILDEVIDTMPETDRLVPDNVRHHQTMKEQREMINAIRQSLMQYETAAKNPAVTSPSAPPVYSVQSPVSVSMGGALYGVAGGGAGSATAGAGGSSGDSRLHALALQQRSRLLQLQRSQQMLVSPEAAEQPQADLGSTINALVSTTPPNVALIRADYHHNLYPSNQMGPNYGTNKINTSQQNPMLSRQLNVSGGYGGGVALHTPISPQPYHRMPRPHLVGGYYEEGGGGAAAGYAEYGRCTPLAPHAAHAHAHIPHPPHPPHPPQEHQLSCGGSGGVGGGGGSSEYVRNELRAVVGARSARPDLHTLQPPDIDLIGIGFEMPTPGGGSVVGGRAAAATNSWDSQQSTSSTTEAGSAEVASAAAGAPGGDEAGAGGAEASAASASLLQKLLSQ